MRTSPATPDRGIRSIFTSAMGIEEKPVTPWRRLLEHCDRQMLRHVAVGALAGAVLSVAGFGALMAAMPTGVEIATTGAGTGRPVVADMPKADRMVVTGGKLAAVATATSFTERSAGDITIGNPGRDLTLDEPISYTGQATGTAATGAIERAFEQPRIVTASLGEPTITPPPMLPDGSSAALGEDDDDSNIIPVPRARPDRPQLVLPLPRPRPAVPVVMLDQPQGQDDAEAAPPAPQPSARPAPGQILGFFSSPTEPVKAPSSKTISIDTPFGVPYVLQQGSVETACLKPELVDLLRKIEGHYHQKVVITSGFRDRGRQGSLHRQCAAADIEVPGVDAASLAAYARTIADIGGVGTYCHAHMIHVDIGTPRDWKFGCGGSFFAMRGGAPGKWGKVPGSLARVSTGSAAEAAQED